MLRRTLPHSLPAVLILLCCSCDRGDREYAAELTGGDPYKGEVAIRRYGCAACHTIPGIRGADALVGPPLTAMGSRTYIAGRLENTPENLIQWLENPRAVDPRTAMPNLYVTDSDARDIASYLYSLR